MFDQALRVGAGKWTENQDILARVPTTPASRAGAHWPPSLRACRVPFQVLGIRGCEPERADKAHKLLSTAQFTFEEGQTSRFLV